MECSASQHKSDSVAESDWEGFKARVMAGDLAAVIARRSGTTRETAERLLATHVNEGAIGLAVARRGLAPGQRVLEVGAGIGIVSLFLRQAGYDVWALEPVGEGFELLDIAAQEIRRHMAADLPMLPIGAQDLDPKQHGMFDFIFSVNVLEHVPDFHATMDAMAAVLQPGGRMVHSCPNYWVPYEPHFSLPLIPGRPRMTTALVSQATRSSALWRSLNFVTYGDMTRAASRNGLTLSFVQGLLAEALRRLDSDAEFAKRHSGLLRSAARLFEQSRLIRLLDHLPAALCTPMIAELRKS